MRDDFFTLIHKGLRKALFDATVGAGRCDWTDRSAADAFMADWRPLQALLEAHTEHENEFFFALAEQKVPGSTGTQASEHVRLDEALGYAGARLQHAATTGDPAAGLDAYRVLASFVGAYLAHLHEEETIVMPLLWEHCSDDELAACRGAFMASLTPEIAAQSRDVMLAAMAPAEIAELQARLAALQLQR